MRVVAIVSGMHLHTTGKDFVVGTLLRCSNIDEDDLVVVRIAAFWSKQVVGVAGKHVCNLEWCQKLLSHPERRLLRPRFHLI